MSGETLVAFWLAVSLLVVTLIGAFGWLVALSIARDAGQDRRELRSAWRRYDAQQHRLMELRLLNNRLISRIRDVEPKSRGLNLPFVPFQPKHIAGCRDPNCDQSCRRST